ncbi:hypothetical protein OQA88_3267 [Cercophora sp. LCS_1]
MDSFLEENPVSELPKTYQDAMSVAVALRFQYLWIDSLCVIQDADGAADWKEQSSVMGLIYKHAACNIAATWATDGSQGCFSQRDPAITAPTTISIHNGRLDRNKASEYDICECAIYRDNIGYAPLNRRGWVLQERYLARRQLNFAEDAEDAVYWECNQLVASEQFPDGLPKPIFSWSYFDLFTGAKPRIDFASVQQLRRAWIQLVEKYSKTSVTVYTDRKTAIAAEPYMAPTWSWAKFDAEITVDHRYVRDDAPTAAYFLEIVGAIVTPHAQDLSGLHGLHSGTLEIRGITMWARFLYEPPVRPRATYRPGETHKLKPPAYHFPGPVFTTLYNSSVRFRVYWDERFEQGYNKSFNALRPSDLLAFFVAGEYKWEREGVRHYEVDGLLLAPDLECQGKMFTRVGAFTLEEFDRLFELIIDRLGLKPADLIAETEGLRLGYGLAGDGSLRDSRLADLVQEITII